MNTRQKAGSEHVQWREIDGVRVEVVGSWNDDTPDGQYDFYDLYMDGDCINIGNPCYAVDGLPKDDVIRSFIKAQRDMEDDGK